MFNLHLTSEQQAIRDTVRDFVRREIKPIALERERLENFDERFPWEVLDQDVLDLLYAVPREEFVPPAHRNLAFSDMEIPLGEGERMWAPKIEARALQALALKRTDRVLEIGTGSGYLTALLAHRAAHVYSVEIRAALAGFGRAVLVVRSIAERIGDPELRRSFLDLPHVHEATEGHLA